MTSTSKPKIAITGPNKSGNIAWFFTALNIRVAGGEPIRVTPESFNGTFDYDGVIIGGGSDIHPEHFIKEDSPPVTRSFSTKLKECLLYPMELMSHFSSHQYDKDRDDMEIQFIHYALDNNLPLLKENARIRSAFPRKTVLYTTNNSLISRIAGDDPLKVNAIHSQAVAKPADMLEVTAKEEVGINQVIESKNSDKVLGVQWHPEYLFYMKAHRKIFSWLLREAIK